MNEQTDEDRMAWLERELRRVCNLLGTVEALQERVERLERENALLTADVHALDVVIRDQQKRIAALRQPQPNPQETA